MENNEIDIRDPEYLRSTMSYKAFYADRSIPKQHSRGLGSPKPFAGGLRTVTENFFKRLRKKKKIEGRMNYEQWLQIIKLSNQKLMDSVLTSETGVRLPVGLGILRIEGFKPNKDKKIYIFDKGKRKIAHNLHSFGYVFAMRWIKGPEVRFKFRDIYHFVTTRAVKQTMCMQIESDFPYSKRKPNEFCK